MTTRTRPRCNLVIALDPLDRGDPSIAPDVETSDVVRGTTTIQRSCGTATHGSTEWWGIPGGTTSARIGCDAPIAVLAPSLAPRSPARAATVLPRSRAVRIDGASITRALTGALSANHDQETTMQTSTIPIPTHPAGVSVALGEPKRGHAPFRVTVRLPGGIGDDGQPALGPVTEIAAGRVRVADATVLVDRGQLDPAIADHLRASVGGAS